MITTAGIFRRCARPPRPSFNRTASPSPWTTENIEEPEGLRRRRNAAGSSEDAGIRDPCRVITAQRWRRQSRPAWFSTSASSPPPPSIDVTVTKSSSSSSPDPPVVATQNDADAAADEDRDPRLSIPSAPGSTPPTRAKSADQVVEEEILSLQSQVQQHHRHAAYSPALEAAAELLELTDSHFGALHPATASAHNNVGLMNKLLGNYHAAREAYHESLRVYGEVCGKDHASYAAALSNLGMLERGRVLESEALEMEGEDTEGDDAEKGASEDDDDEGADLKDLRDANAAAPPKSAKMSSMERMQLNESAIEYFDESHRIRLSELGPDHPHTIASRSQLGSAMAAAVVAERRGRIGGLVEAELRALKRSKDVEDAGEMEAHVPEAIARAATKSISNSKLTRRRWEAAEEHLRGALGTAVENPRGESVGPLTYVPIGSGAESVASGNGKGGQKGLTLPLKKDRSLSKKDRQRAEKERRRERRRANANSSQSAAAAGNNSGKMAVQGVAGKVTTLSAATAAQNLAVFLKNYSDWLRLTLIDESGPSEPSSSSQKNRRHLTNQLKLANEEARHLYEAALHVRSLMLPPYHPEVVASKFSLAELLDAPATFATSSASSTESSATGGEGELDKERANALREEILSAYDVQETDESDNVGSGNVVESK